MAHYDYDKDRATKTAERLSEKSLNIYNVWEFPKARIWKWFVATDKEYQHELILLKNRKNKKQ